MRVKPMSGARVFVREDGILQFEGWKIDNPQGLSPGFKDEMCAILDWMRERIEGGEEGKKAELHFTQFTTFEFGPPFGGLKVLPKGEE